MFCKYCGKELREGAAYCPYCGKKQKSGAESASSGALSRRAILVIVIVVAAAVAVSGIGISSYNNDGTRPLRMQTAPKLSAANVEAAQQAVDAVDKYFEVGWPSYGSGSAASDLREAENNLVAEEDAKTQEVVDEIASCMDKIIVELDLNEKTIENAIRVYGQGGETADEDVIRECRDEIERLINTYS